MATDRETEGVNWRIQWVFANFLVVSAFTYLFVEAQGPGVSRTPPGRAANPTQGKAKRKL
jgi:hypothetical protein